MEEFNMDEAIVTLYDENGDACEYEILDVFEFNGATYAGVTPYVEEIDDEAPIEVTMLKITEDENGEELFSCIESEEEEQAAYDELLRRDEE